MKKTNTKTSVKSEKAVGQKKVIDKTVQDCLKFEEVYDDGLIKVDKDTYREHPAHNRKVLGSSPRRTTAI